MYKRTVKRDGNFVMHGAPSHFAMVSRMKAWVRGLNRDRGVHVEGRYSLSYYASDHTVSLYERKSNPLNWWVG